MADKKTDDSLNQVFIQDNDDEAEDDKEILQTDNFNFQQLLADDNTISNSSGNNTSNSSNKKNTSSNVFANANNSNNNILPQSLTAPKKEKSSNRKQGTVHFSDQNNVIMEDNNEDSPRNSSIVEKNNKKSRNNKKNKINDANIYQPPAYPQDNKNGEDMLKNSEASQINHEQGDQDYEVDYGKGETPLDLFLEGTYEDGKKTTIDPLTVYQPRVEPRLVKLRGGDETYLHFNEKSYYNPGVLRNLGKNDGFLGYYSDPTTKENKTLKMLVCVTMYSEERVFLEQTLYNIFRNLKGFEQIGLKDFQIGVVVIQDGITKMKEEVVDFYCDLEGANSHPHRNLKLRRYEIQRQTDFLEYKNQKRVLDSNEGLPNTIPKRIALVYQNRLQFVKDNDNNKIERPKVFSSNHDHYNINSPGMTVLSVFKHKNAKKLSSHMWFFEGFCRQFRPKYCALVDVGTNPSSDGLLKFYISMEGDPRVGGVCGFLGLEDPPEYEEKDEYQTPHMLELERILEEKKKNMYTWQQKLEEKKRDEKAKIEQKQKNDEKMNDENEELENKKRTHFYKKLRNQTTFQYLVLLPFMILKLIIGFILMILKYIVMTIFKGLRWFAVNYLDTFASLKKAQLYEYTMAHMVDKNFESLLGFLHVLPGAWSAYRYEALEVKFSNRQNLLQKKYFKQLVNPDKLEGNIKEANMFLAEDRILCLGIYCQPDQNFMLKFIPDAKAFTDPVGTLEEFMNQRRRWINSTLFALDYVLKHYSFHVTESSHNNLHKSFLLPFNMLFAKIGEINTYFIPAFYFFVVLMSSFQLMTPKINKGYLFIPDPNIPIKYDFKCEIRNLFDFEVPCDSNSGFTDTCFVKCETSDYPRGFYVALNFIPLIYIVCFLLIVFASLTFKVRLVTSEQYHKLRRSVLDENQEYEIKEMEEQLQGRIDGLQRMEVAKEIKKEKKEIEKDKKKIKRRVYELSQGTYSMLVAKISEHSTKLNPKQKKFKIEYDKITSQEYANDMFKILAAVMSVIVNILFIQKYNPTQKNNEINKPIIQNQSMVVTLVVGLAVAMNVVNSDLGLVKGFVKLDGWLRIYVIVMVVVNLGSFFMILLVHLLLQPKLVWYIATSYWSYIVYQPIYNFILIIFSFCNIDDVTWGTKGLSDSKDDGGYYQQKIKFLVRWFASNTLLLLVLIGGNVFSGQTPYIILGIGLYGTSYLTIKTILAIINYVKYFLWNKMYYKYQVKKTKKQNLDSQELLKQEYNKFISSMDRDKMRSQSRYDYQIYQQNPSISGSVFQENFVFHSRLPTAVGGTTAGGPAAAGGVIGLSANGNGSQNNITTPRNIPNA